MMRSMHNRPKCKSSFCFWEVGQSELETVHVQRARDSPKVQKIHNDQTVRYEG